MGGEKIRQGYRNLKNLNLEIGKFEIEIEFLNSVVIESLNFDEFGLGARQGSSMSCIQPASTGC